MSWSSAEGIAVPWDTGRRVTGGPLVLRTRGRLKKVFDRVMDMGDIMAAAVARRDGPSITHTLPDGVDPRVAAMTAAIVGTSEMAAVQLAQGEFGRILVEWNKGRLIRTGAGEGALLMALAERDANLGLVFIEGERAAKQVNEILCEGESNHA